MTDLDAPTLGRLEDLPSEYLEELERRNLTPLWPSLRALLPPGAPRPVARPALWRYADVRPLLIEAGRLTPIEKAERRVLVLANPGHGGDGLHCTSTIYVGLQLILPGEVAPPHRHTPSAARVVIEGEGGYTSVEGERLPMSPGDLILTPALHVHAHGHEGVAPMVWMDALDLPLIVALEASYVIEGARKAAQPPVGPSQMRFAWKEARGDLEAIAARDRDAPARLDYRDPVSGDAPLPTLGFSAWLLRPGESVDASRESVSAVFHIVEGAVDAEVAGESFVDLGNGDVLAAPNHAKVRLANRSARDPAWLMRVDDAPLHRKLGIYEVLDD